MLEDPRKAALTRKTKARKVPAQKKVKAKNKPDSKYIYKKIKFLFEIQTNNSWQSFIIISEDHAVENPVWCWCREEESGDILLCEGPSCPIKWFHFKCVGLLFSPTFC